MLRLSCHTIEGSKVAQSESEKLVRLGFRGSSDWFG